MDWFRKCSHFWYLIRTALPDKEDDYQGALQQFKSTWRGSSDKIYKFIQKWYSNPQFNIQDVKQYIKNVITNGQIPYVEIMQTIKREFESLPENIFNQLADFDQ